MGGAELTPIGAQRSANADGSIPAWTGGITEIPAGYKVAESQYDMISDRYIVSGLNNEMKGYQAEFDVKGVDMGHYTPSALRRAGR